MTDRASTLRGWVAEYLGLALVLVALVVFFGLTTDYFLTLTTFRTIANQIPDILIVATGMTFVLIVAGVDLSVGSVLALGGAVFGVCLVRFGLPLAVAAGACLGVGLLCGALNGLAVARWSLPSFIVTLGMLEAARGAAYLTTSSQTMYVGAAVEAVDRAQLAGLSAPFLIALAVVAAGQFVLSRTVFGRYVFAVGANEEAARYSGVDTRRVKWAVFALSGLLSALASIFHVSRLAAADPNAGIGLELQAIAAVVIGGTSLMGGRGSVVTSFFGVLIIAVLGTGLVQIGAQDPTKRLVTGCVIVVAVIVDYYRHRLSRRGGDRS
jgi:ribose transport system permease protein